MVLRELTVRTVGKVGVEGADVHNYVWIIVEVTDNTQRITKDRVWKARAGHKGKLF